uniref:Aldehyde dehydrogenase n=1 Tax=Phallusia mammillata TaxID=59560 RepID=A0A6F9D6R3_9ASCI|nr:aldehyde dehydrogenase, dimeric NADP-preferring-like [Phallusia mammillata]
MCAAKLVENVRQSFRSGVTKPIDWRIKQLNGIVKLVNENEQLLIQAVLRDIRKPKFETVLSELIVVKNEANHAINNIHQWVQPTYLSKYLHQGFDSIYLQKEPLGVTLIIGAWNYPILLVLAPLVGAIAAGNCAVLKPSEVSSTTSNAIAELLPKYLDQDCFPVWQGGIEETTEILDQKFDHIFYTGSSFVGKKVMAAAAKNLTPVTLELGGKSPAYIDKESNIDIVANRITWGKFINSGQTCTSCDYILCHEAVVDEFCKAVKKRILHCFGEDPKQSLDLSRIINDRNFSRIAKLMDDVPSSKLVVGGVRDPSERYIAPTVYRDISMDDTIMQGEIFGPLMPIISVSGHEEAIRIMNSGEKPLAMYVFSNNNKVVDDVLDNVSSGGTTVNDVLMQAAVPNVPFGGVGNSGMGSYHGKFGFNTFTHERPVVRRTQGMEMLVESRYPPYTDKNLSMISWLISEKQGGYCNIL